MPAWLAVPGALDHAHAAWLGRLGSFDWLVLEAMERQHARIECDLGCCTVGGAALTLVPDVGPFGAYWISDRLNADQHARKLAAAAKEARSALGRDTARDAAEASKIAERAQQSAKRVPGLKAHAAFVGYLRELRFGVDAPVRARAKVLLDELSELDGITVRVPRSTLLEWP